MEEPDAAWAASARAEFANKTLHHTEFDGFIFPGDANFRSSAFNVKVSFSEAQFHGKATFREATFKHPSNFKTTQFHGAASFVGTKFSGPTDFRGVSFLADANFMSAEFSKRAFFDGTTFAGTADFEEADFAELAWFKGSQFRGRAEFQRANFQGFANFHNCCFLRAANFNAINAETAFDLGDVTFDQVPNFIQAHFLEAPRLDNVQVPRITTWDSLRTVSDPDAAPRYRALKRLALLGHDHDREQRFFADEIRSLRGDPDRPWPNFLNLFRKHQEVWPGGARYWFGILYEVLSNFGRSMPRPLVLWALATVLFAEAYFARHFLLSTSASCLSSNGSAVRSAAYMAVRKGLIFPGLSTDQKLDQAYACLYGTTSLAGSTEHAGTIPIVPDSVAYLGIIQTLFSAVLIFLFLLAVRNHFRIK